MYLELISRVESCSEKGRDVGRMGPCAKGPIIEGHNSLSKFELGLIWILKLPTYTKLVGLAVGGDQIKRWWGRASYSEDDASFWKLVEFKP